MKNKRTTFFALLLLLAYMPTVLVMSLHTHHDQGVRDLQCEDCIHHRAHTGHLATGSGHHLCLLCYFAQQTYFGNTEYKTLVVPQVMWCRSDELPQPPLSIVQDSRPSRASPCI